MKVLIISANHFEDSELLVPYYRLLEEGWQVDIAAIARAFFQAGKPVAAICHGPQILVSAGLLKGRHATCYSSVAPELQEAGALYEDRAVVVDGRLVTSRQPSDLPDFMRETMKLLKVVEAPQPAR